MTLKESDLFIIYLSICLFTFNLEKENRTPGYVGTICLSDSIRVRNT